MHVICDFDGTITRKDTTDCVLAALADPSWEAIEALWVSGKITAAECMRRQIAMIGGDDAALNAVLDAVELDPHFVDFVAWCESESIPMTVVSDGVDHFIHRILDRHGLGRLPVIANHLVGEAWSRGLEQPWNRAGCAAGSGVCKCAAAGRRVNQSNTTMVFVGDGRSDFCVSAKADVLFAKEKLADYAADRGQAHHVFDTFADVTTTLSALLAATPALIRQPQARRTPARAAAR
jgi:2-hydroxy-3-keto-5-methylthiopentenyl-1-phosphate phosphatase